MKFISTKTRSSRSAVRRCAVLFGAFLVLSFAMVGTAKAVATAETGDYQVDGNKMPISATTTFFDINLNADLTNTAQHEVGHAFGFTTGYELWANHVTLEGGGPNRQYKTAGGTVLARLEPVGSNHMRTGLTVDGNNQTNDIMRPDQVVGQVWGAQDTKILRDAFDWQLKNITVNINFGPGFTNAQKATITAAANTVKNAIGGGAAAHTFTWDVELGVVPEPGTMTLLVSGVVVLAFAARKRKRR